MAFHLPHIPHSLIPKKNVEKYSHVANNLPVNSSPKERVNFYLPFI
jgi:hypothetical protein